MRTLRSDSQLRILIRAVIDVHSSDEQHFVEWKATLSLGKTGKKHNDERGYEIGMLPATHRIENGTPKEPGLSSQR